MPSESNLNGQGGVFSFCGRRLWGEGGERRGVSKKKAERERENECDAAAKMFNNNNINSSNNIIIARNNNNANLVGGQLEGKTREIGCAV